jgi:hypothetical protein
VEAVLHVVIVGVVVGVCGDVVGVWEERGESGGRGHR